MVAALNCILDDTEKFQSCVKLMLLDILKDYGAALFQIYSQTVHYSGLDVIKLDSKDDNSNSKDDEEQK